MPVRDGVAYGEQIVRPDGYIAFTVGSNRVRAFLEVDCCNVSLDRIKQKLKTYGIYERCGAFADVYRSCGFVVMFITGDERRLDRLLQTAQTCATCPGVCGTTFSALRHEGPKGQIWRTADDLERSQDLMALGEWGCQRSSAAEARDEGVRRAVA